MQLLRRDGWRAALAVGRDAVTFRRCPAGVLRRPRSDYAAMIAAYEAGASMRTVMQRFELSSAGVYHVLRRAGILPHGGRRRHAPNRIAGSSSGPRLLSVTDLCAEF
jgi:predicted deacylase